MKIAYKVFHTDGLQKERDLSYKKINEYLLDKMHLLETPTIKISSLEDYENFVSDNKEFVVDRGGYDLANVRGWRFGEIGILASNWKAWNNFLNSRYDYLVLMEDDIEYKENFYEKIKKYISDLPDTFDVFSAFVPRDQFSRHDVWMNLGDSGICFSYQDWSCLCYVVSRSGAKKLIENFNNVNLPLDWYIYRQTDKFSVYSLRPSEEAICDLIGVESTFQTKEPRCEI